MNILEKIITAKRQEVQKLLESNSAADFENYPGFEPDRPSFHEAISAAGPSVITEFKRRSPSKGEINPGAHPVAVCEAYQKAGASAVSVLTDKHFAGTAADLAAVTSAIKIPVLRKDFMVDEIQLFEARALGASAVLLIAAALEKEELKALFDRALSLDLDVLFEIHQPEELDKLPSGVKIVGINNRNLKTFVVDIEQSVRLAQQLPGDVIKVSESGISSPSVVRSLFEKGFDAFLVGENFMKEKDPAASAFRFMQAIIKPEEIK